MGGHGKVENAPPVVTQDQKHIQDLKPDCRHGKKVNGNQAFHVVLQKVLQVCEGGLVRGIMYLLTLVSPMSIPSFSNSP